MRKGLLGEILVETGALLEALSAQYGAPHIKESEFPETPPVIEGLPIKFLKHYRVAPIRL